MKKIMYIPLDERPCNYNFINVMLKDNEDIELIEPPLSILGFKKTPANYEALREFMIENISECYGLILSIDMLLYGGIVPSRLHNFSVSELVDRLRLIKELKAINPNLVVYAYNLIMRCPQYSSSDEEPDYYEHCGYNIFKYGELMHKQELGIATKEEIAEIATHYAWCKDYIGDYLDRRHVNSDINIIVITLLIEGIIDFLVFPQDDSSMYGFIKKDQLKIFDHIRNINLDDTLLVYPGADEVGMVLVSRMINHLNDKTPKIYVEYHTENGHLFVPMFEDRAVYKTVKKQLKAAGCVQVNKISEADGILMMNNPTLELHDANVTEAMGQCAVLQNDVRDIKDFVKRVKNYIETGNKVSIADVSIINRGELELVKELGNEGIYFDLAGYSGWNTSSNTLGTALTHLIINIHYGFTPALQTHLALRIFEDIGYCGHTRHYMCENVLPDMGLNYFDSGEIKGAVSDRVEKEINTIISEVMPEVYSNYHISDCYMPWCRMFEVALEVEKSISKGD